MQRNRARIIKQINFYSDESCHIQFDDNPVMTLATVYCSKVRVKMINNAIRTIKANYGINSHTELKWNKVSKCNLAMYKEIIDYIVSNTIIKIRVVVAKHKQQIISNEDIYGSYDSWYSKMYYNLLKFPLGILKIYSDCKIINLFIDKKDSHSFERNQKLVKFLKHNTNKEINSFVSDSKEHELIQIADIIAGAASYAYRDEQKSDAKRFLAEYIQRCFKIDFKKSSKVKQTRANVFIWNGRDF